jgi:hypothetical protein
MSDVLDDLAAIGALLEKLGAYDAARKLRGAAGEVRTLRSMPAGDVALARQMRDAAARVCEDRADYFASAPGHREWTDAVRSYRATAQELRSLSIPRVRGDIKPDPSALRGNTREEPADVDLLRWALDPSMDALADLREAAGYNPVTGDGLLPGVTPADVTRRVARISSLLHSEGETAEHRDHCSAVHAALVRYVRPTAS